MSVKGKNWKKLAKLPCNHFLTANNKLCGKNQWLWVKTEANLISKLKIKIVWNTFDKELGGEMKSVSVNNFQKSFPFREMYVKYLEKNSIYIGIVYSYITQLSLPISREIKSFWQTFD